MTASSATISGKLNRAEILVDGADLLDIVVDMPYGRYDLKFIKQEEYRNPGYYKYTFELPDGKPLATLAPKYRGWSDPEDPRHVYVLNVIKERASKA